MKHFYCHEFNPIFLKIGSVSLYWYGLMYGLSFIFSFWYLLHRSQCSNNSFWTKQEIEYLLFLNIFGVVLGGRFGYFLFYQWPFFYDSFYKIFNIWEGGMSFHGGLIGVIVSIFWFSYHKNQNFLKVSDFVIPAVPFGLGLGRFGNFINGELWGKVTVETPWAILFPRAQYQDILDINNYPRWKIYFDYYGALPRHPSQLYEMFLEGIVLFVIINIFMKKPRPVGSVSSLFLILYGIFRIVIEFFRQPDSHIGYIINMLTLGQILSFPMIIFGFILMFFSYKK